MVVLTEHRVGEPVWIDLMSSDPTRAEDFYANLFGWVATPADEDEYGGYVTFVSGDHVVAGLGGAMGDDEASNAWVTYLKVIDADATLTKVADAGGRVLAPVQTVGEQGRLAIFADPSGAACGIWEAIANQGYEVAGEIGSVVWHELTTRDFDAAVPFYEAVFDWHPQPLDAAQFRYVTFGPGEPSGMVGGVYDAADSLPAGMQSHWRVYFGVDDVDAATKQVEELGGAITREPWDSEFGRFAQVSDPTGAMFLLSTVP
jgi:uncharacterized protein